MSWSPLDVSDWSDGLNGVVRHRRSRVGEDVPDFDELVSAGSGKAITFLRMPVDGEDRPVMTLNVKLRLVGVPEIPHLNVACEHFKGRDGRGTEGDIVNRSKLSPEEIEQHIDITKKREINTATENYHTTKGPYHSLRQLRI